MPNEIKSKYYAGLLAAAFVFTACGKFKSNVNASIQNGSKVKINYQLTVDGKVVDSSAGRPPLEYVQGAGQIVPGLEEALAGMKPGDKKTVTVTPDKGYGQVNPKALRKVPKKAFQKTGQLKPGMAVQGTVNGKQFQANVVAVGKNDITLDFNHPLAGKTLTFDVEVVEVTPAG